MRDFGDLLCSVYKISLLIKLNFFIRASSVQDAFYLTNPTACCIIIDVIKNKDVLFR